MAVYAFEDSRASCIFRSTLNKHLLLLPEVDGNDPILSNNVVVLVSSNPYFSLREGFSEVSLSGSSISRNYIHYEADCVCKRRLPKSGREEGDPDVRRDALGWLDVMYGATATRGGLFHGNNLPIITSGNGFWLAFSLLGRHLVEAMT